MHIHRTRDAAVTILLKKPPAVEGPASPKPVKVDTQGPSDYIGINDKGRLLFFSSSADLEEQLTLTKTLLRSYPNFCLYTKLLDAHFYIFSRWTLDVLYKYEKQISSLKGEFIPFLVKLQIRKKLKKGGLPEMVTASQSLATSMSSARITEKDGLGCYAYVMDGTDYCLRVNTVQAYLDANRDVPTTTSRG